MEDFPTGEGNLHLECGDLLSLQGRSGYGLFIFYHSQERWGHGF